MFLSFRTFVDIDNKEVEIMSTREEIKHVLESRFDKELFIKSIESEDENFNHTIAIALSAEIPSGWRATWMLKHTMEKNDRRILPFINAFIDSLTRRKEGHQREILQLLLNMTMDEEQEGRLFDLCMTIWEKVNQSPSVRITAFRFLHLTAQKYPELSREIEFLTQDHYTETLSPGIKNSLKKLIAKK